MPTVTIYNQEGIAVGKQELSSDLFAVPANPALVHQVVVALQARPRRAIAHTKQRGEVSGGGKKPWKQKHTGRARHGSTRSPIWRHGGVTFGPRSNRNFEKGINATMKRQVLRMVLSDKVREDRLLLLDSLTLSEAKTKKMAELLTKLPLKDKKAKVLLALSDNPNVRQASRNLPRVHTTDVRSLNILDLLASPSFVTTVQGIEAMVKLWGKK